MPRLTAAGCATTGGQIDLALEQGLGASLALLLFGPAASATPPAGTCLPTLSSILPVTFTIPLGGSGPGTGSFGFAGTTPSGLAGLALGIQCVVADSSTPKGFATSNAVELHFD